MQELPDFYMKTAETIAGMKVHQLAMQHRRVLFGSFVGAANAAKVLRGVIRQGAECRFNHQRILEFPKLKNGDGDTFLFRQTGLGKGYVHAIIEPRDLDAFMVFSDADEEWHRELLRVTTVPVLIEWVPWLRQRIKDGARAAEIDTFNCDVAIYDVDDDFVSALLIEGGESNALVLPECELDMAALGSLPEYIRAYAQRMVESAGSSLRPLLDPKREIVSLPSLARAPFAPQAWLIEGARRLIG